MGPCPAVPAVQCVSLLPIFWADPPEGAGNYDMWRSSFFLEQNQKMVLHNILFSIEQMHALKKMRLRHFKRCMGISLFCQQYKLGVILLQWHWCGLILNEGFRLTFASSVEADGRVTALKSPLPAAFDHCDASNPQPSSGAAIQLCAA